MVSVIESGSDVRVYLDNLLGMFKKGEISRSTYMITLTQEIEEVSYNKNVYLQLKNLYIDEVFNQGE